MDCPDRLRRYRCFDIPSDASHNLGKDYRRKLILQGLQLDLGETCLEIGCGIPFLSLDIAALSGAAVLMLDLRKLKALVVVV